VVPAAGRSVGGTEVPIGPINEVFEETLLADYAPLGQAKAQNHFVLLINGQFELVTKRDTFLNGRFSPSYEYNHALILTGRIVAWEIDTRSKAKQVRDRFDWYGDWEVGENGIAGKITKIAHAQGKIHKSPVEVVSLKELISRSFKVEFINPPPSKKPRLNPLKPKGLTLTTK